MWIIKKIEWAIYLDVDSVIGRKCMDWFVNKFKLEPIVLVHCSKNKVFNIL